MSEPSRAESLLRAAAAAEPDPATDEALREACRDQDQWESVVRLAERHGLAPLLYDRIESAGGELPETQRRELRGLGFRHQGACRIRTRALTEILAALADRDIQVLVLKGMALAHLIYERPGLRPMSDIDILVSPDRLSDADRAIAALDYQGGPASATLPDHHHLPTVSRSLDGLRVSVEVHHDALARDNIGSIRLDSLSEPPRAFSLDRTTAYTFGHLDTLRHLCRHALEPRETMKLGSALDILLYATRFRDEIDWPRLHAEFPEVVNTLRMLGYLIPWPASLSNHVTPPAGSAPAGVGVGLTPLSALRRREGWPRKLLNPSDWWLRAFYNVPVERSLVYTKTVRHPARVLYWLWRRTGKLGR